LAPLSCREFVELVTAYLEGALAPDEQVRFEEHLGACVNCTAYLEQLRQTLAAVGRLRVEDLSPAAEATLLDAFRDWHRR
jgi:anti-sigma factor RsiW